uniref:Secreted protein n=1 Tax=Knipowitschia caucasica TaxID=637954 RepID=A0AAV2M5L9_KNICA
MLRAPVRPLLLHSHHAHTSHRDATPCGTTAFHLRVDFKNYGGDIEPRHQRHPFSLCVNGGCSGTSGTRCGPIV